MKLDFKNNYIKRVSFYAGLIAFFIALGISVFSWFNDTLKEMEILTNDAQSTLAPYIKWYQEDSSKELERYSHLSKAEFEKLNVDSIINKNLQDIRVIAENRDALMKFDFNRGEEELRRIGLNGTKSINAKFRVLLLLLEKEEEFNPKNTYFVLDNPKRYQNFLELQNFLNSKIKEEFLDKKNKHKISILRLIYTLYNTGTSALINLLMLLDVQRHTCQIDRSTVQNVLTQHDFIRESEQMLLKVFEGINKDEAMQLKEAVSAYRNPINESYSAIQTKLKECKGE